MKQVAFVDADIFIRYLTNNEPLKHQAYLSLFKQAEANQIALTTSESVIAEVVSVLSSCKHYGLSRKQIQFALSRLLLLLGFQMLNHGVLLRALGLYAQHALDFEDCLTVIYIERDRVNKLYSYGQEFDRFNTIRCQKPEAQ